jgi:hypothetical protein
MGPHDLHEEWLQQRTSPKQGQKTPATPVFYSVGRLEDVGCYTGENLPQDVQRHQTSLSDGVAQVDALSRLLSARAKGDTRAEQAALRRLEDVSEAVLG